MPCKFFILLIGLGALIFPFSSFATNKFCENWFADSGIKPGSKDCARRCILFSKDIDIICTPQCGNFCLLPKCLIDFYWRKKLKNGKPPGWNIPVELATMWKENEKKTFLEALSSLPDQLKTISFDGFYRLKKSIEIVNPATTDNSGNAVVIYDRAFDNPNFSLDQVLTHEIGHILYARLTPGEQANYLVALDWKVGFDKGFTPRSNGFISSRAKDSPYEDFAENISFALTDPMRLKNEAPKAYQWIFKKFGNTFKMKPECRNAKI